MWERWSGVGRGEGGVGEVEWDGDRAAGVWWGMVGRLGWGLKVLCI